MDEHPRGRVRVDFHYRVSGVIIRLRSATELQSDSDRHCRSFLRVCRATVLLTGAAREVSPKGSIAVGLAACVTDRSIWRCGPAPSATYSRKGANRDRR